MHELKALNPKPTFGEINKIRDGESNHNSHKDSLIYDINYGGDHYRYNCGSGNNNSSGSGSQNVHFKGFGNLESFNSTSKSIKTNKTIFGVTETPQTPKNNRSTASSKNGMINNLSQVNEILNKQML